MGGIGKCHSEQVLAGKEWWSRASVEFTKDEKHQKKVTKVKVKVKACGASIMKSLGWKSDAWAMGTAGKNGLMGEQQTKSGR